VRNFLFVLPLTIFLSACVSLFPPQQEAVSANERPAWIDNPGNGVSASAGTNIYGRVKQEETAIARARTEFAKRFGVSIESGQVLATTVASGHANTTGQSSSIEKSNQSDVKAMVKAKWRDEDADVLWVWLVPSN
jgi:hypothetical protein